MPSNRFHLNEARINRVAIDTFPMLIADGLGLSQRHFFVLERRIAERFAVPVVSYHRALAVVGTSELDPTDYWDFLDSESLEGYERISTTLGSRPFRMRRRIVSAILGNRGRQNNVFEEGLLEFYEYAHNAIFHKSLSITMLEDAEYYRFFLEPGYNVLYRLTSLSVEDMLDELRNCRLIEAPSSHAGDGGFLGFLVDVEDASSVGKHEEFILIHGDEVPEQFVRLKRTRGSQTTYLVPSQLVSVKPSYDLLTRRGHLRALRDRTLLRPAERLKLVKEWYDKLFPEGSISVADGPSAEVRLEFDLVEPVTYDEEQDHGNAPLFYPDNPLKFGPTQPGHIHICDPYKGLRHYGPWDLRTGERPFDSVRPYIIYPRDEGLRRRVYWLFKYFSEGGYVGKAKAWKYDRSFRGFDREFRVGFDMPAAHDAEPYCDTEDEYLEAADTVIDKWSASDGDPSRIAVVVFPFDQEDTLEGLNYSKRLYPRLKQKFIQAGLPSQMIDRSTLEKIDFDGTNPCFEEQSYFGHVLWNLALNIYVKLGGRPWTLQRELDNVNCLIGLSFTVNTLVSERPMYVGVANIFDELGEWVDIVPDQRQLTDSELKAWYRSRYWFHSRKVATSKLPREFTAEIVKKSLQIYQHRRNRDPLDIAIHKTGRIHQVEVEGALQGIRATGISLSDVKIGFVSVIQNQNFRIYGEPTTDYRDNLVVRRGVMCPLDIDKALLTTTGRTETSGHSLGTPQPLEIRVTRPSSDSLENLKVDSVDQYSSAELCERLMALTQLHWGSMRREIKLPVTILYSKKVASLSTRAEIAALPRGRIHRPWFI